MCGRYTLITDFSVILTEFHIQAIKGEYQPSDNVSPGQRVLTLIKKDDKNRLVSCRWGLIPAWAKDPTLGNKMFNARAETVALKPSFRQAFHKRRCLIIADGFYEWAKLAKQKIPYRFSLRTEAPFGLAGLYETWTDAENKAVTTCTIITTEANELTGPIHDRMPVIVPKDKEALWLDPGTKDQRELAAILKPFPAEAMKMEEGFLRREPWK